MRAGAFKANVRTLVAEGKDYPALSVTKNGIVPQLETAAKSDDGDNRKKVLKGDFVINSRSDRKGSSGASELDGSVSLICTVMRPQEQVHTPFVHHLLRSQPFQEEFYRNGKGIVADLWSTNYSEMRNILLGMPPLAEQTDIAAFLDRETAKIDALVAEQQRLMELLKEKRQAVISHAVTGKQQVVARKRADGTSTFSLQHSTLPMKPSGIEWLGDVPAHWEVPALNYRYEVELGKMLDEKRITGNHLAPYLRNTDVQWGHINVEELPQMDFSGVDLIRYRLKVGDLLVCEGGEVGRAAIWNGELAECFYQKALHRIRPRDASRDSANFLFFVFQAAASTGVFSGSGGKSTIAHLPAEALRRYRFAFPPRGEQLKIVSFLEVEAARFDTLTAEAQRAIDLLQERRTALISAAVTGQMQIDVSQKPIVNADMP